MSRDASCKASVTATRNKLKMTNAKALFFFNPSVDIKRVDFVTSTPTLVSCNQNIHEKLQETAVDIRTYQEYSTNNVVC